MSKNTTTLSWNTEWTILSKTVSWPNYDISNIHNMHLRCLYLGGCSSA